MNSWNTLLVPVSLVVSYAQWFALLLTLVTWDDWHYMSRKTVQSLHCLPAGCCFSFPSALSVNLLMSWIIFVLCFFSGGSRVLHRPHARASACSSLSEWRASSRFLSHSIVVQASSSLDCFLSSSFLMLHSRHFLRIPILPVCTI